MLTLRRVVLLAYVTCLWSSVLAEDRYAPSASEQNAISEERPTEKVPDLQIGCEEGYSGETPESKESEEKTRKARSYFYTIRTPSSFVSVWKPAFYRIQRPYYIPIYGAQGQIPFYFPPQPIFTNPGFPLDNPPVGGGTQQGSNPTLSNTPHSGYLPPKVYTTTEPDMFDNRFGEEYPVWDSSPARPQSPPPSAIAPTRRPKPARTTTVPPLIHNIDSTPPPPPPAVIGDLGGRNDLQGESTATPRPSQCVWAIINCCSAGSQTVSNSCFERFACPGPFWDRSPCESNFARLAIQSALGYYADK